MGDACSFLGDTSCLINSSCEVTGIPQGYPVSGVDYGGAIGVSLEQTVNGLVPGNTYVLEFWAGGESYYGYFSRDGLFGVNLGFGYTFLRSNITETVTGIGTRYIIEFNAVSTSHVIKFTNWGHICDSCTELILDDVRLYTLAELSPSVPACSNIPAALFTAPNNLCPGTCTNFTNLSSGASSFQWSFPGGNPSVSTDISPSGICYTTPGSYNVTLIASNGITTDTLTMINFINVYQFPSQQGIMQNGDTLFSNQGATTYQWYFNGNIISGATDYFYVATASGNYNVVATDDNGCEVEAVLNNVIANITPLSFGERSGVRLFPNPVSETIDVRGLDVNSVDEIEIYNVVGEKVFSAVNCKLPINCKLSPGMYYLEIISNEKTYRAKFLKD